MKNGIDLLDPNINLAECLNMAELKPQDLEALIDAMKQKTLFYQAETARIEAAFLKLQLVDDGSEIPEECEELVQKLNNIQHKFNVRDLSASSVALSHAHMLRKHHNYSAKLKICLKMYIELNESLNKKVQHLKTNYEQAREKVDQIVSAPDVELKTMSQKISRYENELTKLEKKYPWLKDDKYNLPNISIEINLLIAARKEKENLMSQLNCYAGLKPDLQEASEQLRQIKLEYQEICQKLSNK